MWMIPAGTVSEAYAQVVEEWTARYNGPGNDSDRANSLAVDASGNVYVTGFSIGNGTDKDYATIKYNPSGDTLWVQRYNGPGNNYDNAHSLAIDSVGNVYVTGGSSSSGLSCDYATIKYDSTGDTLWVRRYNGPGDYLDEAFALAVNAQGNVYITGWSDGIGTGLYGYDYATIKYNSLGEQQWVARYDGPGNSSDYAYSLAIDLDGNVYVTGRSQGNGTNYDYATIKYNSLGEQQWVARYNGPGNNSDEAQSLAVDADGNVYVTGWSDGIGTGPYGYDYATIKYNSLGEQQWVARYDGQGNSYDHAHSLAIDSIGNVYVTGGSSSSGMICDYATIKYDSTGDTLWVRRYNGPGDGDDTARSLALDVDGNVYITGNSVGISFNWDYTTIKYNSAGFQQWVQNYNGSGNGWDFAFSLALDANGNVYIAGESKGSVTQADYTTIKYSPVQNQAPEIIDYEPTDLDTVDLGQTVDFWASATDPDGDSLSWEWRLDGDVVGMDSAASITFDELGNHQVTCWVSDGELADSVIWDVTVVEVVGIPTYTEELPGEFALYPAHPNPFNPSTKISWQLATGRRAIIKVFDILGNEVATLINEELLAGKYEVEFNGTELTSGIYFYRLQAGNFVETKKMMLMK